MQRSHQVVVLGGGYAGVRAATDLADLTDGAARIVLVSRTSHHVEMPTLYEVATAFLQRESATSSEQVADTVAVHLGKLVARSGIEVKIGEVERIDFSNRLIVFADRSTVSYDALVLAVGCALNTFGVPGVLEHTFSVATLADALMLRHHIVRQFFTARHASTKEACQLLTFAIIGGGAAGVEIAAELAGQVRRQADKHGIDCELSRTVLLEAQPHILRELPPAWRERAAVRLRSLGVEIIVNAKVSRVEEGRVLFAAQREPLPASTIIWAGGLAPNSLLSVSGLPLAGRGVAVEETLQVAGRPGVFAVGDCAMLPAALQPVPATVPVAYTQGALAARNVLHYLRRELLERYRYRFPGAFITLGGKRAVAVLPGGISFDGRAGWLLKQLVSLRYWLRYLPPVAAIRFWVGALRVHVAND